MLKKSCVAICLLLILPGLLFITACSKRAMHTEQVAEETAPAMEEMVTEQKLVPVVEEQDDAVQAVAEEETQIGNMATRVFDNEDIYFDFDSAVLKDTAKESLIRKAEWFRMKPDASIIIEGHCDERGTSAYNIALGDRRAQSAKAFFVDLGLDSNQISTVSYGEERPVDVSKTEEAWAKNRRAHFVID